MTERFKPLDTFLETSPKGQWETTGPLHPVFAVSAITKSKISSISLSRKLDDYFDVMPPKCDRCCNNGQLPGNFFGRHSLQALSPASPGRTRTGKFRVMMFFAIPHFLNYLYYCYSYSFGHLFVVSLFQKYLEEGEAFVPKYLELLKAGGKDFPVNLAKEIGVDLSSETFWQGGFDFFKSLIQNSERWLRNEMRWDH